MDFPFLGCKCIIARFVLIVHGSIMDSRPTNNMINMLIPLSYIFHIHDCQNRAYWKMYYG